MLLSSIDNDYRMLEQLISSGNLDDITVEDAQKIKTNSKRHATAAKLLSIFSFGLIRSKTQATCYDAATFGIAYESLMKEVEEITIEFDMHALPFPNYACINHKKFGAYALSINGAKNKFIILTSGAMLYFHLFAKLFAYALPVSKLEHANITFSASIDEVNSHLDKNPKLITQLTKLLLLNAFNDNISKSEKIPIKLSHLPLINLIRDAMQVSVIGHEYGHIRQGHLGVANQSKIEQELEADKIGALISIRYLTKKGYSTPLAFAAINLSFIATEMAVFARDLLLTGKINPTSNEHSETHPSLKSRRAELLKLAKEMHGNNDCEYEQITTAIRANADIANSLYSRVKKQLLSLRAIGNGDEPIA